MTGKEVIDYINGMHGKGIKAGLENMRVLLAALGNPQKKFKSVHVAGTNGKGSTCAYLDSILRVAGYSVGLYTSPYLQVFNERIRVNGECIDDRSLGILGTLLKTHADILLKSGIKVTFFELCTALSFLYFAEKNIDIAVIETGIGGRLDCTNVIEPDITVITRIGYDHMSILGDTLGKIAFEKAGIIKNKIPCVLYPQPSELKAVFKNICLERESPLTILDQTNVQLISSTLAGSVFSLYDDTYEICIPGGHQTYNAACAVAAAIRLGIDKDYIKRGVFLARWPGRLEWFGRFLLDGAHNEQGAEALVEYISENFRQKIQMIVGVLSDKPYELIVKHFSKISHEVITVKPDSYRALDEHVLAGLFINEGVPASPVGSLTEAMDIARARQGEAIVISGSLYLVGQARTILHNAKT